MFSPELGLAIEKPPRGVTVEQLWKIISGASATGGTTTSTPSSTTSMMTSTMSTFSNIK